jgi:hypothetical protein
VAFHVSSGWVRLVNMHCHSVVRVRRLRTLAGQKTGL